MKSMFILAVLLFAALLPALFFGYLLRSDELMKCGEWKQQYRARRKISDIKPTCLMMWLVIRAEVALLVFILTVILAGNFIGKAFDSLSFW